MCAINRMNYHGHARGIQKLTPLASSRSFNSSTGKPVVFLNDHKHTISDIILSNADYQRTLEEVRQVVKWLK